MDTLALLSPHRPTTLSRRRFGQARRTAWVLASIWTVLFCLENLAAESWDGFPLPASTPPVEHVRYSYDMRGSVRILFFWIGKSGVGGGSIDLIKPYKAASGSWAEGIQILFGSDPDAVPGGHNRWGYARELSYWEKSEADSEGEPGRALLQKVVFEGFMTTSKEESLDEVEGNSENDDSDLTAFEATISRVLPDVATAELRRFRSSGEVSYREPGQVGRQYLDVDIHKAPDITRRFENLPRRYNEPAGFLTSLHQYIKEAIRNFENKKALEGLKRVVRNYVHNALLYSINLKKTKKHKSVELNKSWRVRNVLELEFEARREGASSGHRFSVWVPVEGDLAGVPIRIVDKPRWWLRVELTLQKPDTSGTGTGSDTG